jgi:hypothetical protein
MISRRYLQSFSINLPYQLKLKKSRQAYFISLQLCDQLHEGLPPSSLFYQALLQNLRKKQKLTTATSEDDLGSDAMAATTPSTPKTPATAVSTPLSAAATGNTPLSASASARSTFFFGPDFNPEVGES